MPLKMYMSPVLILIILLTFLSCKKERSCEGCINGNRPPIANAGPDQVITLPTDSILLDGSASHDLDGTITAYQWTKISGSASFNIVNSATVKTVVKDLVAGTYQFELKVTDNKGLSAKDTMQVIIDDPTNRPPIANAGPDQSIILPTNSVILDGSSSTDPDNNITSYLWTKISGPSSFNITNTNTVQTQVINLVQGVYKFELKVTDSGGLFSTDTIQATIFPADTSTCNFNNLTVRHATLTQIGTLSVPRMPAAATAGNKIIFAGGWANISCDASTIKPSSPSSVVDIYDVISNTWTTAQLSMPRGGIRTISCGTKIFFAGGENGISTTYDNVDIYDVLTNTWSVAHLSLPRAYVATATVGNKVFFAGGLYYNNNSPTSIPNNPSNSVDIYDVSTDQWTTATLSGTAKDLYMSTTLSGKVYFSGGNDNGIIDIYDNNTGVWSIYQSHVQWTPGWGNPTVSFASGNNMYWAGIIDEGYDPNLEDNVYTGRVEILNTTNNITSIQCSPIIYSQQPVNRNDEIAFFTSYDSFRDRSGWGISNTFTIYSPGIDSWSTGFADFSFRTVGYDNGIISANNKIYVGGGSVPSGCYIVTDKVYVLSW